MTLWNAGPPRGPNAPRAGGAPAKVLPIDVPAVALAELNRLTGNFGDRSLVGEGSYGRVYRATLSTGEAAAVKMFDNNGGSGQSEADFCAQVNEKTAHSVQIQQEKKKCKCYSKSIHQRQKLTRVRVLFLPLSVTTRHALHAAVRGVQAQVRPLHPAAGLLPGAQQPHRALRVRHQRLPLRHPPRYKKNQIKLTTSSTHHNICCASTTTIHVSLHQLF
jgi:hypothetical protein